jgi:threonine dehydrogenase-like Zn-dependent dehydrogenase
VVGFFVIGLLWVASALSLWAAVIWMMDPKDRKRLLARLRKPGRQRITDEAERAVERAYEGTRRIQAKADEKASRDG